MARRDKSAVGIKPNIPKHDVICTTHCKGVRHEKTIGCRNNRSNNAGNGASLGRPAPKQGPSCTRKRRYPIAAKGDGDDAASDPAIRSPLHQRKWRHHHPPQKPIAQERTTISSQRREKGNLTSCTPCNRGSLYLDGSHVLVHLTSRPSAINAQKVKPFCI